MDDMKEEIRRLVLQISQLNNSEAREKERREIIAMQERNEVVCQESLVIQQSARAMTELLMHHNRALTAKGIL